MRKIAPHVNNKRGSMLMLTLIVFMVILILGMTMITSMLYSQGENNMQINEQKAYYAAFSAVEAVKSYFLNPELNVSGDPSSISPRDLIDKTCTYSLKDHQEIDEDTTVEISIRRAETDSEYILIEATGRCNGEESVVTARMREEVQKGSSSGLYSSGTVIACNRFVHQPWRQYSGIEGNIFVDNTNTQQSSTIGSVDLRTYGQGGKLFIRSKGGNIQVQTSNVGDVFFQSQLGGIELSYNKYIENIYFKESEEGSVDVRCNQNEFIRQAQFLMDNKFPVVQSNKQIGKLILSVTREPNGELNGSIIDEKYIHIHDTKNISEAEDLSSYISNCKQYIEDVMKGLDQLSEVLSDKQSETQWSRPDESSGFIKLKEVDDSGIFEEYYNEKERIRLVFCNPARWGPAWIKIKKGSSTGVYKSDEYTISVENPNTNLPEQVFFIAKNSSVNLKFQETSINDELNGIHIYAPNSILEFSTDFKHFKGSIIAGDITVHNKGNFIFEEPRVVDGMELPGGTGSSSSTTYTYHFEEYVETDKK